MRRKARVQTALEVISLYDAAPLALCALAIVKLYRRGGKTSKITALRARLREPFIKSQLIIL
jgi:hypothetical protein